MSVVLFVVVFVILVVLFTITLNGHLVLLLVLHQQVVKLVFVDFDHVVLSLFTHHLLFAFLIFIIIIIVHKLAILLHPLLLLHIIFVVFDLLLHTFNTVVLDVDLVLVLLILLLLVFLHFVLINLVHLLLLLLVDGLGDGCLLLRVKLVEILDVLSLQQLLSLLLLQGHLVVRIFVFIVFFLFLFFRLHFVTLAFSFSFAVVFVFVLILIFVFVFTLHLVFLVILFLDLVDWAFHLIRVKLSASLTGTSFFLHEGLASVLGWEVRSCHVQAIVVLSRDQKFALLVSEMLIWVVASLSEKRDEVLQLLDLIEVVDECFRDLLDKKGSVSHLELDLLLYLIVLLGRLVHLLGSDHPRHLTSALQSG